MMPSGRRRHRVTLATRGTPVADGAGGYTETPTPLDPAAVYADIRPATQRDLERIMANVSLSVATHIVTMPYHAGVTTKTVLTFGARTLHVTGVANPDERNQETVAVCVEVVA